METLPAGRELAKARFATLATLATLAMLALFSPSDGHTICMIFVLDCHMVLRRFVASCIVLFAASAVLAKDFWEEHTSELQSLTNLVCRLLLEKKKNKTILLNSSSIFKTDLLRHL